MKKYNRIWMIIMSMLLLFCQPLTVSATEPSAEQESETEEDEGDLQDEEESGSPEADGQEGEDADEDEVEADPEEYAELEAVINEAKESQRQGAYRNDRADRRVRAGGGVEHLVSRFPYL